MAQTEIEKQLETLNYVLQNAEFKLKGFDCIKVASSLVWAKTQLPILLKSHSEGEPTNGKSKKSKIKKEVVNKNVDQIESCPQDVDTSKPKRNRHASV